MITIVHRCIIVLMALFMVTSCTTLQWRASDAEIDKQFKSLDIPTEITYFEVDSLDLKVRIQHVTKEEHEIDILFFHGSPSSLSAWNSYLKEPSLLAKANMHAVDRPGYGYSNFGDEMPSIQLQAKIMSALINEHNMKRVLAIGSSYGGPLVAYMAVLNDNIEGVIMISPAIDPQQEKKFWASRLTQWWITRWMVPTGYRVAGDEKTVHTKELEKIEPDWKKVTVPVVHIHGNTDAIVPFGNVNYTAEQFNNIKIISLPDIGHELAWGRPELVIPHILELLDQLSTPTKRSPK